MRPHPILRSALLLGVFVATPVAALPALQLGAGSGSWTYNVVTQTWETSDNPLNLLAFANATEADGGNGGERPGGKAGHRLLGHLVLILDFAVRFFATGH